MAWQDFHGLSLADATAALRDMQAAKLTGNPVEINVAGVKTVFDPRQVDISKTIAELQKYVYEVNAGNIDPETPIDPYAERPGITRVRFY